MKKYIKKITLKIFKIFGITRKRIAFPMFRHDIYSQNGEDGIVEFIIKKIPSLPKYIIDIGANDGVLGSNSRLLIEKYKFGGLLVEPFSEAFKKLEELYAHNDNVEISNFAVGCESTIEGKINWHGHFSQMKSQIVNINDLLSQYNIPKDIGFLSIDIDGNDNDVLSAIDWTEYSPIFVIQRLILRLTRIYKNKSILWTTRGIYLCFI
ncbi:MAG: hypothetical protein CO029_00735 [Candidatus Magasanikbacteria bacterium CG_4_9_14_0_2_um_filter_41_10]|nr:MAG: hypothetical protein AUJ37_01310 [Candidatus Magasanikbacteria bacterium CG1_02_41_34]PJC53829.1 MAG: hypothetical protein CO029_00735 [Candidatus Magasanikbacteria bacterium CG_4_9_14_0_2_um_filter_41_10]